jgi:hypothetical protein
MSKKLACAYKTIQYAQFFRNAHITNSNIHSLLGVNLTLAPPGFKIFLRHWLKCATHEEEAATLTSPQPVTLY